MIHKTLLIVGLLLNITVLTACNTMQGLGKDLEKAGEKLEKSAK